MKDKRIESEDKCWLSKYSILSENMLDSLLFVAIELAEGFQADLNGAETEFDQFKSCLAKLVSINLDQFNFDWL